MSTEVLEDGRVRREITLQAGVEAVWEALATDAGRERWLEPCPERELVVETADPPRQLVWWWWEPEHSPRRVELRVLAVPAGTRVIVTETAPRLPLAQLSVSLTGAAV